MNITEYLDRCDIHEGEKPLDYIPADGGFTAIFRTIACIGDSLSSGEFEAENSEGKRSYHDYFEYSWGQFMARQIGAKVYNFSRGGMTAVNYRNSFAENNGYWGEDKLCQAYILALGVNDILNRKMPVGTIDDIDLTDYNHNSTETFAGNYAYIIQRYKSMQPDAKFFLITIPRGVNEERNALCAEHAEMLYKLAEMFDNTYVIDLYRYAPVFDQEFRRKYNLRGHMNPMGYLVFARMVSAYIDYIIRSDPEAFQCVGFIGKDLPADVIEINRALIRK